MKFNKLFFVLLALTLISMASLVKIRRTEAKAATETDAEAERRKRKDGENIKNEKSEKDCLDEQGELKVGLSNNDKEKCKKVKEAANAKKNNNKQNVAEEKEGLPKKK